MIFAGIVLGAMMIIFLSLAVSPFVLTKEMTCEQYAAEDEALRAKLRDSIERERLLGEELKKYEGVAGQRDELLAVVKELEESSSYWSEYDVPLGIVDRIRAAIARAEGGEVKA